MEGTSGNLVFNENEQQLNGGNKPHVSGPVTFSIPPADENTNDDNEDSGITTGFILFILTFSFLVNLRILNKESYFDVLFVLIF